MEITLENVAEIEFDTKEVCPECGGDGALYEEGFGYHLCPKCG